MSYTHYTPYLLILIDDTNIGFLEYLKNNYDYSEEKFNDITGDFHIGLDLHAAELQIYLGTIPKNERKSFVCISTKEEYELIKLYANLGLEQSTAKLKTFLAEMGYENHN